MKKLLLILAFSIISLTGFGQSLKTSMSLGSNVFGGNYNAYIVNTQMSFSQDSTKIAWNLSPSFTFGQIDRDNVGKYVTNQRESYLTGNLSHKFGRHRILGTAEAENSFLKKIQFRGSLGLGYGYDFIRKDKFVLLVSEAIMPETYNSNVDLDKNAFALRLSTRIKFEYGNRVKLTSITMFQPAIYTSSEVRVKDNINLRSTNSLEVPVVKGLTIGLVNNINMSTFSTYIDSTVSPLDWNVLLSIKYKNF